MSNVVQRFLSTKPLSIPSVHPGACCCSCSCSCPALETVEPGRNFYESFPPLLAATRSLSPSGPRTRLPGRSARCCQMRVFSADARCVRPSVVARVRLCVRESEKAIPRNRKKKSRVLGIARCRRRRRQRLYQGERRSCRQR